METKFLIIGVGGAGCKAADVMDIPNSKKLFVGSDNDSLKNVKSEGFKFPLNECGFYNHHQERFRNRALLYKDEIKECIKAAFEVKNE